MPTAKERQTRQRTTIQAVIAEAGVPLAPKEILDRSKRRLRGVGLATVYRTLKLLGESGVVRTVEIPGESPRFELADKAHHHHFSCRACGKVFEIEGCCGHFDDALPPGFELEGHEVILFGRCRECVGRAPQAAAVRGRIKP